MDEGERRLRFLRLRRCSELLELLVLVSSESDEDEEEEVEPRRRSPRPRAQRAIDLSITDGIMLKPSPDELEDEELEDEMLEAKWAVWPACGVPGLVKCGLLGSGPL